MSSLKDINIKIKSLEKNLDFNDIDKLRELCLLYQEKDFLQESKKTNNYETKRKYKQKLKKNYGVNYWIAEQENEEGIHYYKKVYNSGGRRLGKKLTAKKMRKIGANVDKKGAFYRKVVPYDWYVY